MNYRERLGAEFNVNSLIDSLLTSATRVADTVGQVKQAEYDAVTAAELQKAIQRQQNILAGGDTVSLNGADMTQYIVIGGVVLVGAVVLMAVLARRK